MIDKEKVHMHEHSLSIFFLYDFLLMVQPL
ncbi:hypothetical protein DFP98_12155 [Cohnella phaseoli]|uniref:Uncharacterized protein n=1 Tax=Cohnella phaseoli TaxID=456490 RepID=A0A3D9ITU7_9BACL|nr:hypothetical protein DFP98_12155 [Cohnella phaseoli]